MIKPLFLVAVIVIAVPLPAILDAPGFEPTSAQGIERLVSRSHPPSCSETIKGMGLEGQPVQCVEPRTPTYDPPRIHGKYRLYPESYVGPLTYEDLPDTAPAGVVSDDIQIIRKPSLYLEPAWLPEGYALTMLKTGPTGSEDALGALYEDAAQPISISRVRRYRSPIDVIAPGPESALSFEAITVAAKPGILWYPKPEPSPSTHLTTALSYLDGKIEITVMGEGLNPEVVKRIAGSIGCEPSCGLPIASGVSASRGSYIKAAANRASSSSSHDSTSISATSQLVDDEHRVIAG